MNKPTIKRAIQCSECGCFGHHLMGCPEGERQWELAEMRLAAEIEAESEGGECENQSQMGEPYDAVSEIMAHFISIYGQRQKNADLSQ